jgi:PAS domain S-box-containing protein
MVDASNRSPSEHSPAHDLLAGTIARPAGSQAIHSRHRVQFYEDEHGLAELVAAFLADGLAAGAPAAVIATAARREAVRHGLQTRGLDVAGLIGAGTLTLLDARDTLDRFMRDGDPDPLLFESAVGQLLATLCAGGAGTLRAYGEMVDVLWQDGQRAAALRLEELWNDLQDRHTFALLCAYSVASFYKQPSSLEQVCAVHDVAVVDGDRESAGILRQLAREIAHRSEVEVSLRESLRELRRKEEQLRHSEQLLRDFVENATVGLHQVGPDGTILWANRAELELLGYSQDEYIGRSIVDVHADRVVIDDILARLSRGEEIHDYEARLRAKDGSIRHVLISSNVHARDGQFIHTRCFTRDITARRQAERALRDREAQLQTIIDALPMLVAYVGVDHRYQLVSASYERWFGRSKDELRGEHLADVIGAAAYEVVRPELARALSGQVVSYEVELVLPTGARFVHATYIPQRAGDREVDGVVTLVVDITERKAFERYRAEAAQRAERLLTITSALADAVTAAQVYHAVVDRVAAALGASSGALWLTEHDGRHARLAHAIGYSETSTAALELLPLDRDGATPASDVIRKAEPIWIPSQGALLRDYPHLSAATTPGRSYHAACLPLVSDRLTLGVLAMTFDDTGESSDEDRSFLQIVARYAGQAIERLRLLEAERRSRAEADAAARRMSVLGHAARVFVDASFDVTERVEHIGAELGRIFAGSVGISLIENDGRLHTASVHHPVPEAEQQLRWLSAASPIALGEGITGRVAQSGESALLSSGAGEIATRAAPAYRAFIERYPTYVMMVAPLRARDRIIGTVTVSRTRPDETYSNDDLGMLDMLAERAASAIENARLHRDSLQARAHAERLYRFAHAAASADKLEDVLEAALDAIEGTLGTDRAAVLLFDDAGAMRFRAWRRLSDDYRRAVDGHSPWLPDAAAPQPVLVEDVDSDPAMQPYRFALDAEHIRSLAFIPLFTRGALLGKFMIYYRTPHRYTKPELELAATIANHLASVAARFAALGDLERAVHYSELFAGVLAHDLRNPLGAIMTAAQLVLMRQEGEGERTTKPISRIVAASQRMSRMIDQLLDFTRARVGGGIEIQARDTNLAELCSQVIGELELVFTERQIACSVTGDQDGTWDPDRVQQIVSNLVANAGQHGTQGTPVTVRLDGSDPARATLEVHNCGAIPPALLPTLFDPFRGTRYRRDQSRGLGLGLFIVKELVRAHGGTVDVRSSEVDGTTFRVVLPRHARP